MSKVINNCRGLTLAEAVLLANVGCEYSCAHGLHAILYHGVRVGMGISIESAVSDAYNALCAKGVIRPYDANAGVKDFFNSIEDNATKKEIIVRWLQSGYMLQFIKEKREEKYMASNGDVAILHLLEDIGIAMYAI